MERVALYTRVSTDKQVEKYGLGVQAEALRQRAQQKGYLPLRDGEQDLFVNDGYSGGTLDRPALRRLRDAVRLGQVQVVLTYDPDRLSRNLGNLLWLVDEFGQQGVHLEFMTVENDASAEGDLFFNMKGAVGQFERAKTRQRTRNGILEKLRQGKVVSSAACPFGYRFDPAMSTLVVHEEEAETVRLAFVRYTAERLSVVQLADWLTQLNLPHPAGGKRWYLSMTGRMLRNETYAGVLWQHRWEKGKERPQTDWVRTEVPAIVPRALFDAAQRRLEENQRFARRNTRHQYLLAGLVRHACGGRMSGHTTCQGLWYYRCARNEAFQAPLDALGHPARCTAKPLNGARLEAVVWNTLADLLQQPDLLAAELERLQGPDSTMQVLLQTERRQVEQRLRALPVEEDRLVEGYRRQLFDEAQVAREMAKIRHERADATVRVRDIERQLALQERAADLRNGVMAFAARVATGLAAMTFTHKQELLRLLVEAIGYHDDGTVTIKTILPTGPLHPVGRGLGEGAAHCSPTPSTAHQSRRTQSASFLRRVPNPCRLPPDS